MFRYISRKICYGNHPGSSKQINWTNQVYHPVEGTQNYANDKFSVGCKCQIVFISLKSRMRSDGEREPDLGLQVHVPLHRHHHEQPDGRLCHPRGHQVHHEQPDGRLCHPRSHQVHHEQPDGRLWHIKYGLKYVYSLWFGPQRWVGLRTPLLQATSALCDAHTVCWRRHRGIFSPGVNAGVTFLWPEITKTK